LPGRVAERALSLTADQVRIASLAMLAAYAAMAGGAFVPSYKRRHVEGAPVRGARQVPAAVDGLWVAAQGAVGLLLLVGLAFPQFLSASPLSLLPIASLASAVAGVALFVSGCGLIAWAALHLGAELTVAIETREGGRLVTSGPYAAIRHPIYTGVFLLVIGESVALASPALATYTLVAVYCANVRARAEENLLSSDPVHGAAYRDYQARTGAFLPSLKHP
jgi:protein-S-isoprenylcysteine O-methyltransferase Ste14